MTANDQTSARKDQHETARDQPQPIAIVGMGAIMPEAPDGGGVLGKHHQRAATASPTCRRTGGTRSCTTTPTRARRTRPTPASAAGSATSPGTRSAGTCRCRPRSAIRWTTARSGRSPRRAPPSSTPAGHSWNVDPERVAVIIGNAIGGEKQYATNLRIQLPEFTRELARSAAFARCRASIQADDHRRDHPVLPEPVRRDHRGHHAG